MVEAMYERSPAYIKQFQKNFRFFFSEKKPSSMFARNYSVCMHFQKGYCELLPSNHYLVLFDVSDVSTEMLKRNKLYAVPCLYTTLKTFFSNSATVETTGEIFEKLKVAVEYNSSAPPTKGEATSIQKRQIWALPWAKITAQVELLVTNLRIITRKHWISNYKLTGYQLKL